MLQKNTHTPVMLKEVLQSVSPKDGDVIVDATFGRGGYTCAFLKYSKCKIYAIDRDPEAVHYAQQVKRQFPDRFCILHGRFANMARLLQGVGITLVDGIVFDLGVSSPQLEQGERGFSFKHNGPLDMRMSAQGVCAKDIVNTYSQGEIAHIIKRYGEEKMAGKIARAIVYHRQKSPIETTEQLANIVRSIAYRKSQKIDAATRTFQGLRIAVNDELGEIEHALKDSIKLLRHEGRLVAVSFHSLEDRLIKNFINREARQEGDNRHFPEKAKRPLTLKVVGRKIVKCSEEEAQQNPRARSAKLRMAVRIR